MVTSLLATGKGSLLLLDQEEIFLLPAGLCKLQWVVRECKSPAFMASHLQSLVTFPWHAVQVFTKWLGKKLAFLPNTIYFRNCYPSYMLLNKQWSLPAVSISQLWGTLKLSSAVLHATIYPVTIHGRQVVCFVFFL